MNKLSWMLYFADLLPTIGQFAWLCFFLTLICVIVWCSIVGRVNNEMYDEDKRKGDRWQYGKYNKQFLSVLALCAFFGVLIPGRNTMYAIAASQMGEQALKTPLALKAEKAIEAWLDKQIATK